MKRTILDTVVLRVMSFAHPQGIQILFDAIDITSACFPTEVYNRDEDSAIDDEELSELARGLRYAKRQTQERSIVEAQRYLTWLQNAQQLYYHLDQKNLIIEMLTIEELYRREQFQENYSKCDRGEAACLVLAHRYQGQAVFLSSDEEGCKVADDMNIPYLTLPDILSSWVQRTTPTRKEVDVLVEGMANAQFRLKQPFREQLYQNLKH